MKKNNLITHLKTVGYSNESIKKLLYGKTRPSWKKAILLQQNHNIPYTAWVNIKSYIENDTKKDEHSTSTSNKQILGVENGT